MTPADRRLKKVVRLIDRAAAVTAGCPIRGPAGVALLRLGEALEMLSCAAGDCLDTADPELVVEVADAMADALAGVRFEPADFLRSAARAGTHPN